MDKLISAVTELLENERRTNKNEAFSAADRIPEPGSQQEVNDYYTVIHRKNLLVRELATELALTGFFPRDPEKKKRKAAQSGINTGLSGYSVVFVRVVDSTNVFFSDSATEEDNAEAVKTIICSIFGELLSEGFYSDYAVVEGDYAFLVGADLETNDFLRKLAEAAENAVNIIEGGFAIRLLACIGPYCRDFASVGDCFRLTLDLREYSMSLHEPPTILVSGDIEISQPIVKNDAEFMSAVIDHQYMNAILSYDFQTALEMTKSLIDERYGSSPERRRGLKPFLSARLDTTVELLSASFMAIVVNGVSAQTEVDRMLAYSDFNDIISSLEAVYDTLDEFYNRGVNEQAGTVGSIIAYVTENYAISSLSVGSICEELGKSRSYLSRIFKQNTGMNLLDFLHTTRIAEAKRLLIETPLSITEIGERVGYYSGWTLARVFKRYEGITPSVYRNRIK